MLLSLSCLPPGSSSRRGALRSVLVFVSALAVFLTASPQALAALPDDFQVTQIIGSGLDGPSAFELAPDGRIFILERTGKIKIYKNGGLLEEPFADLPSVASGDRGLIGIAFDPDFSANHFVYFYYTGTDQLNRLVRFNAAGDVATGGPFILYQTTFPSEWLHVGGSIRFGPDGKLYFAVGDNGNAPLAQRLDNPHGKILRINKDGTIPADNPFVGTPGALDEIWAYGMRNPWRFQFDGATGRLYGGDVGDSTWEEINLIEKGSNYGWPLHEGLCTENCTGFIDPLYTYHHNNQSAAVTGGPVYRSALFPEEYRGALFFSDYAQGFIKYLKLDGEGGNGGVFDFDTQAGSVVDLKVAPDGSLYYITYFPGRLYQITYATDDHVPIASASANVTKGIEPLTVKFSSGGSSDPDGDPLSFAWDFGDGTSSTEANPTKIFSEKGTYTVELTVSDGSNVAQAVPIVIQVGTPPTLSLVNPPEGTTFRAGDTIRYQASAVDGAGNDIDDGDIVTDVLLHHDTHTHPFLDDLVGRTNEFILPTTGEAASNIWYEIIVTATDENGLSETKAVNVYPLTTEMTFLTEPAGLAISLEGSPRETPRTITGVRNFERLLGAPTLQVKNGTAYQFSHWNHGGTQAQTLITPEHATTYTAVFSPAATFSAEYFANRTLAGAPVLTRDETTIDFDWGGGSPDTAVPVDNFSARFTKTENFPAGTYNFSVTGDDGVRLFVDGTLVLDKWIDQPSTTYHVTRDLSAGEHTLVLEYYENGGGAVVRLDYQVTNSSPTPSPPPTPIPGDAWAGKYWNTPGAGASPLLPVTVPALTRSDAAIDFDWGGGSPDPAIAPDHFVAQWTKEVTFEAGTYRFTTTSDDGVRVYLDSTLVIDQWNDHPATTHTKDVAVTAGSHALKVEFYENGGGAVALFGYTKLTGPAPAPVPSPAGFSAEYFNNRTLSGEPIFTSNEAAIDFDWGGGSPDPTVPIDNFSARFSSLVDFSAGTYKFTVTADDGVRLSLDGTRIIDQWVDQPPTTYSVTRILSAGNHTLAMEYYERTGGAVAALSFQEISPEASPSPPDTPILPGDAWQGKYWNTPGAGSAPVIPTTAPNFSRNDPIVDFDWGFASPDPTINADHFVAQWKKNVSFEAGTYRFTTTSDDGIRVFVNDTLVVDQWNDHGATIHTGEIALSAGTYPVQVEFYDNTEDALAKMSYVKIASAPAPDPTPSPTPSPDPTPDPSPEPSGYQAQYFDNLTLSGEPTVTREEDEIDFDWGFDSPSSQIPDDDFSARFTKTENLTAGTYRFTVTADDGVRLMVDGETVIDKWFDQSATKYTADVELSAGNHTIVLEYYERSEDAIIKLTYTLEE